ncbi:MAG: DUF2508 family protein [Clostridiales bacterium]|jgi:hypothetical protein|nr:DUF2508 family protein [Clostridiales bacterium]
MEGVLRMIRHTVDNATKKEAAVDVDGKAILEEIKEVSRQMRYIDQWFDMECDSDMIESCIYQREALSARYRYLMNRARQHELSSSPF